MDKPDEIIEGNILIADFIGLLRYEANKTYNKAQYYSPNKKDGIEKGHFIGYFDSLKYHNSWDWLMPVIEKISKIPVIGATEMSDTCYPRTFGMLQDDTGLPMFRFNCCCLFVGNTLIEAAWISVVDFIKTETTSHK